MKYRCVDSAIVEASSTNGRDGEYLFSWPLGTTGSFPDFLSMRLTLAEHEGPKRLKIWLLLVSITCFPLFVFTMNYQTLAIQFTCIYMLGTLEFRINSSLSLFAATPFDDLKSLKLSTRPGLAPTHSHFHASRRAGMRTSSTFLRRRSRDTGVSCILNINHRTCSNAGILQCHGRREQSFAPPGCVLSSHLARRRGWGSQGMRRGFGTHSHREFEISSCRLWRT